MFLNPNIFFQFELELFYFFRSEKPPGASLKNILLPKIVLTFHCLNKLFKWSQKFWKFSAFSLEFQKFFSITTGCKRWIRKMFESKIWEESMLVLKQTIHQKKALDLSFYLQPWKCLDLKNFLNFRPSASNFKSFSQSLEQFFLTVSQNNLGNKIPLLIDCWRPTTAVRKFCHNCGGGGLY